MASSKSTAVAAYPVYHLSDALEVGRVVKELGGARATVDKSLIAQQLQVSDTSPSFAAKIASARCFRIIEGRGSYGLTEQGMRYFLPQGEADKRVALLAFLSAPPSFSKMLERFEGNRLPAADFLTNILETEGNLPKSWSGRVASIFLKAAELAGVIDAQGFLRFKATQLSAGQPAPRSPSASSVSTSMLSLPSGPTAEPTMRNANIWEYGSGDDVVRLETPKDLPMALWLTLSDYVKIIKPQEKTEK